MAVHIPLTPVDHFPPPLYFTFGLHLQTKHGVSHTQTFRILHEGLHRTFVQLPWLGGHVQQQSPDAQGWRPGQLEIVHNPSHDINGSRPYQLKFNDLNAGPAVSSSSSSSSSRPGLDSDELAESGFPVEAVPYESLVWAPFLADISKGSEVLVAQANFVRGGCILTVGMHHSATDGTGFSHVLEFWAANCHRIQQPKIPAPFLPLGISNRNVLEQIWEREGTHVPIEEIRPEIWRITGLDRQLILSSLKQSNNEKEDMRPPPDPNPASASVPAAHVSSRFKTTIFYIAPSQVTRLRNDCNRTGPETTSTTVSVNDAICALVWRSRARARTRALVKQQRGNQTEAEAAQASVRLGMPLGGRYVFSPSLPSAYLGNLAFAYMTCLPLSQLTSPPDLEPTATTTTTTTTQLSSVAHAIRDAAGEINARGAMLAAYGLARQIPDYNATAASSAALLKDGHITWITSLLALPTLSRLSFGSGIFRNGGRPESVRPMWAAKMAQNFGVDGAIIMPSCIRGGVEIVSCQTEEETAVLLGDKELNRYAMLMVRESVHVH